MNGDNRINAIDLVYMQQFLLGIDRDLPLSTADVTVDGLINIIDLIRMKKYISGDDNKTYTNRTSEIATWLVLSSDSGFAIVTPVVYRIYVISMVYADTITYRHVYKASSFAYTVKNPNPEFNDPSIEIGTTKINGVSLNMRYSSDAMVTNDWVYDNKEANPDSNYPLNSNFNCVVSCMQNQSVYPLNTVTNSFDF